MEIKMPQMNMPAEPSGEPITQRHEREPYTPTDPATLDLIGRGLRIEELVLRHIEHVRSLGADARLCAMAKTQIELGWMCLSRAIVPPERISGDLKL